MDLSLPSFSLPSFSSLSGIGGASSSLGSSPAVTLSLGNFTFQDLEVPESIAVGGAQRTVTHRMVGGARIIDVLGADPDAIGWSGYLLGSNALSRALSLKQMMEAGKSIPLSFSQYAFTVVITHFQATFEAAFRIPYRLTCEIAAQQQPGSGTPSVDSLVSGDMSMASGLTSSIGNSGLSGSFSSLQSAISSVSSFASATKAQINSVLVPLAAMQTQVKTLIAAGENTLASVTTVGGILPNNPISQSVAKLSNQVNTMIAQPQLVQLGSVLSRLSANVQSSNSSANTVSVMSGNLFDQAAKQYGDATGWATLVQANPQLNGDPFINGPTSLTVPPYNPSTGGIVSA